VIGVAFYVALLPVDLTRASGIAPGSCRAIINSLPSAVRAAFLGSAATSRRRWAM